MGKADPQLPWEMCGHNGIPLKVRNKPNIFNFQLLLRDSNCLSRPLDCNTEEEGCSI